MPNLGDVAATFHRWLVDDERFGYSQGNARWGNPDKKEEWDYKGVKGVFNIGDRDCSSSIIDVWREALKKTPYAYSLKDAHYTGDMREVFVNSSLFYWHPMSEGYIAKRGDIYLNEEHHTAMCQSQTPDMLTEFLSNEWGGITGGLVGDQTGGESVYRDYYGNGYWDGILEYNGKADYGWLGGSGAWWYKDPEGSFPSETWRKIDGVWYYFKQYGYAAQGEWLELDGKWYYFHDDCSMAESEWKHAGWYYLKPSGAMACDETLNISGQDYYFNGNGITEV